MVLNRRQRVSNFKKGHVELESSSQLLALALALSYRRRIAHCHGPVAVSKLILGGDPQRPLGAISGNAGELPAFRHKKVRAVVWYMARSFA